MLGDFNMSTENPNLKDFMCSFDLESLINSPTCYESVNPTCIDLILTNKKNQFMKPAMFKTGLCNHHKLATTILFCGGGGCQIAKFGEKNPQVHLIIIRE